MVSSDAKLRAVLQAGADKLGLQLTASQQEKLLAYVALMGKWNRVYNLTSLRDPAQMMTHHILDSLTVVSAFENAKNVLDVGSGGGLPGIVLAIWAQVARPEMRISMIDTVHKKTAFLAQVKAELQLDNVHVYTGRVEELTVDVPFDVITSRAFAELNDFVNWSQHLLHPEGQFFAMKGVMPDGEVARLPEGWHVQQVQALHVPDLDVERHLIYIGRTR
jgi:16S rRNA (guanine527-N7)-methyltransferase